jgi:hypothetical protein
MVKVKVTLMSAGEPEIRRLTLENDPDFSEFETRVLTLFGGIGGTFKFYWKGKIYTFVQSDNIEITDK